MKKVAPYIFVITAIFGFCWFDNNLPDNSLTNRLLFFCLLLLVIIVVKFKEFWENGIDRASFFLLVPLLSLVLVQAVGLVIAFDRTETIYRLQNTILLIATFLVSSVLIRKKYTEQLFFIVIAVATIYLFASLWQLFTLHSYSKDDLYNITALNGHKNLFASFILLLLILLLLLKKKWKKRIPYMLLAGVLFALLFFLQTRSAILGLIIGGVYAGSLVLLQKKFPENVKVNQAVALIGVIIIITGLVLTSSLSKSLDSESAQERLKVWTKTIELANEKPLTGYGAGNWPILFPSNGLPDIKRLTEKNIVFTEPHNEYLAIYFESGLLGLGLFVAFWLLTLQGILQNLQRNPITRNFLVTSCFIAYLIIMFFDFPNTRIEHIVCIGLIAGLTYPAPGISYEGKRISAPLISLILVLLICSSVVGAYRYLGESYIQDMLISRKNKDPRSVIAFANKAQSYYSITDNNLVPIAWYAGMAYIDLNENDSALQQFKKAWSINPFNYHVLNNYAVLMYPNDTGLAEKLLRSALKINPAFDEGRKNLVSLLVKKNDFSEAMAQVEKIRDPALRGKLKAYITYILPKNLILLK